MTNSEKIMVCINHPANGERLIRRGGRLAALLHCPLLILTVLSSDKSTLEPNQIDHATPRLKSLAEQYHAIFLTEIAESHSITNAIANTAKQHDITQIIIGCPDQTRWQIMRQGSFFSRLLKQLKDIDIHVLSDQAQS